ncbi:putative ABC transport system ATP-binding protein [Sediminihabitans luteus]|uniref:Putative ABC transport system ATP-binding protein n=1 Tax=Sediminihabitans luteus TaxID=1138585 RepID=A0A2M9CBX1_9CELL|nr:ABC transporter ATP-binding protein [Sediminihabitans luteus]PJJ68543.1 putative ABC transport system ATP-binding protein [Sediminihabitans luteus]GII99878.1 ABC transporter ATP-binding protein [Sediminihabitans luteus]
MSALDLSGVTKTYLVDPPVEALRGVDLTVEPGERVAVLGRSGAGKSTLLNIVGLLDEPTSGTYLLAGQDVSASGSAERDRLRAETFGFVFQESHVLGHRTAAQNVWLGLMASGVARRERDVRIAEVLERVGLTHRADSLGRLLSGGEKQRLAVARAVVARPRVLLADEPTGNLDDANATSVLDLFDEQAAQGVAVVVITHDARTAQWADRVVTLVDGRLASVPHDVSWLDRVGAP